MYVISKPAINAEPLIYWMRERQAIYRRREAGQARPYTTDPILQKFRFCNVFRELDKTTVWIRENWRKPHENDDSICFAMGVARLFNHPESLGAIGYPDPWDSMKVQRVLDARASLGKKVFSPAYIISPCGSSKPKIERVIDDYLNPFYVGAKNCIVDCSLQETWSRIRQFDGFGPFIAYEVVSDLRWTPRLKNSPDIYTWANPGPGAFRGLNRLMGVHHDSGRNRDHAIDLMRRILSIAAHELREEDPMFNKLEMRDIEHSLCETDKYLRVKLGQGRPKELFL